MTRAILALTVLFAGSALAQSGPGGVGTSESNAIWLSADRTVYNNAGTTLASTGNNVQQWNDRSGNGKNASEGTVGNRPNYTTGVLNGLPVIRYTASSTDRLVATGLSTTDRASVWVVANYSSLPSTNPGLVQGSSSGNALSTNAGLKHVGMWVSQASTQPWGRGVRSDGGQLQISQTTNTTNGPFYIINSDYGSTTIQQYMNNSAAGSVATNGTLSSWTDFAIGVQGGTESWNGDIAEVIAFNISLNPAQRIIVANYLAAKYGLALGANDVYTQDASGFDFDVAGIGQVTGTSQNQTDSRGSGIVQISNPLDLNDDEFMMWGHDNGVLSTLGVTDRPASLQGRWARVWRVSERNTTNSGNVDVGAVDITFDLTGLGSVTPSHLRLIVDTDNDGLFADETPISGATYVGGVQYRFTGITALTNNRRFTLGTTNVNQTPLPIELVSFTASPMDATTVRLDWSTASENANDYFTVERSTDAHAWSPVAMLDAVGNSISLTNYTTDDREVPAGIAYYRLRQTDTDGTSTVSMSVAVHVVGSGTGPLIYPNPSSGVFTVQFPWIVEDGVRFTLCDASGRTVASVLEPANGSSLVHFAPQTPSPGLYTLRIDATGHSSVQHVEIIE